MKKLIYGVVMTLLVTVASAQAKKESLQGEWKIYAVHLPGFYYEFSSEVVQLDEAMKAEGEPTAEEMELVKEQLKEQTAQIASNYITFDKDQFKLAYGAILLEGKFELKEKETGKYIEATYTNGKVKKIDYLLKEKLLYLTLPDTEGNSVTMIYKQP